MPHLWPTCSSSGSPPLITARYFSSDSSDSESLRTPCPPPACAAGRQGITPAFGYSAPHPSAGGTLTLLTHALPSTHYKPLRHPTAPGLSLTGVRLTIPGRVVGPPVLRTLSLCTCRRHYPGTATGGIASLSSPQSCQPSLITLSGRPMHRPFRGLLGVHSHYGLHTRAVTVYRDRYPKASATSSPP